LLQRDFKVIDISLKGKAKTPTMVLETRDGERLTLKFDNKLELAPYQLDQEFTVKISKGEQIKLPGA
jgi:hypothetical protein